jgi:type II secretory pathway pseudopilin PulG
MKILDQKGTTTLEVIAALVLFALVAAGLAVALPMAFGRAETWSEQETLARYLENCMEEIRSSTYESLSVSTSALSSGPLNGRQLQIYCATTLVVETPDAENNKVWTAISGPADNPIKGLLGTYYDNSDFTGTSMIRVDSEVNISLAAPPIGTDNTFSVRWTGFIQPPSTAAYTFYINCDSTTQAKLMLNDTIVIKPAAVVKSGTVSLTGGQKYAITMEMAQTAASSRIQLCWQSSAQIVPELYLYNNLPKKVLLTVVNKTSGTAKTGEMFVFPPYREEPLEEAGGDDSGSFQGFAGLYFNSIDYSSVNSTSPYTAFNTYSRIDPKINFTWGDSTVTDPTLLLPTGIGPNNFTVRWTGYLTPINNASYYFYITAHDGVKLWIDHTLWINTWENTVDGSGWSGWSGVYLSNDQLHTVTLDYHYHTATPNNSQIIMKWSAVPNAEEALIPEELLYPVFSPTEDSYVDSQYKTTNYGGLTTLLLSKSGNNTKSVYLKFKVAGLAGKTIKSATLRLYSQTSSAMYFEVKKVNDTDSWNERTINYNNAVANDTYATYNGTPGTGFFDITLDPAMFSEGNGVYGMALQPLNNCAATFNSRETEYSTTYDRGPRLVLLFEKTAEEYHDSIQIEYLDHSNRSTTNVLAPWIKITNTGTAPIDLSSLSIRYWYTRESAVTQVFVCDHAGLNSGISYSNITGIINPAYVVVSPATSTTNYYIQIGFSSQRYLPAGAYVVLQNRIYNSDWSNYTQTNDYSYNPALTSYGENTKVTAYMNGVLFFGTEP